MFLWKRNLILLEDEKVFLRLPKMANLKYIGKNILNHTLEV